MDNLLPNELEELILCSCCHLTFNDTDALPKLFSCRHYFCLKCVNTILLKGKELYCIHCWKRTELPSSDMKPESLPTYNAILYLSQNMINIKAKKLLSQSSTDKNQFSSPSNLNLTTNRVPRELVCIIHAIPESLWCTKCNTHVCRACASTEEHRNHTVKSQNEAKESIHNDILSDLMKMQKKLGELQHLVFKQRDFLLKILESCTTLKTQIETELINHLPTLEISDIRSHLAKAKLTLTLLENQQSPADAYKLYNNLHVEKQRLSTKYNEMVLQCKLEDLIQHYGSLLDFDLLKQISTNLNTGVDTLTLINNNNNLTSNSSSTSNQANSSINSSRTFMNLGHNNLILLLANYCISQLYSHHILTTKTMAHLSSAASIAGSPVTSSAQSINNNNNNSMFLGGLGVAGMMADQYQLTSSMQEHLLHKYSELSTSPSNHSHYLQSNEMVGNGSVATGAGSYVSVARGRPTPSQLQLQTPPPHSSQSNVPPFISDLNGISMPITIMQHNLQQHSNLHLHQGSSNISSTNHSTSTTNSQATSSIVQNPTVHVYPIFFFDIEINGNPFGRILIEVRNDVAPKMSKNFSSLATMELGFGYKGCNIFQCWENESIITGDFELNNGRGGRSVFEESFFMPDDTKILAIRGSVGMRRSQKRHDNMGLVGSQFRIILREMRGFTGIFAFVVEGLDLVDKISKTGDSAGKPQSNVIIVNCGKWQ